MVPHLFFYQFALIALVWLFFLLHGRIGKIKPFFSPRAAAASLVASARLPRPRAVTPCWAPRRWAQMQRT